ncbi:thiolase family protein [bacterium]|nr:thiolase family protein [bacterium]
MRNAVIVDAVRTPSGKRNGLLSGIHAADLASIPLRALVERNDLDPGLVDDVIMGCVTQTGEQTFDVARWALLAAGFPEEVPGVTIDRQCGSSQQAAHFGAQGVMAGQYDIVIASGIEAMSRVPMGITVQNGPGLPFGDKVLARYSQGLVPQGISAELVADKWGISRERLDEVSAESHRRAAEATDAGKFEAEIVPVEVRVDGQPYTMTADEGIRRGTTVEKLAALKPAFKADGKITAGNSSQISDGAAAVLIMGEDVAERLGYEPMARFKAFSLTGVDPVMMLTGPIPATDKILTKTGHGIDDIDLFEINEAFSSVLAAWLLETAADWGKVNVNGGAIALGHPLGASGAKIMTTLVHEMVRTGARYGLQSMCEGGGQANGTLLESI